MTIPTGIHTEDEYWKLVDFVRNEVNAAMLSYYTHRTINKKAITDPKIWQAMSRNADFWRVTSFCLHSSFVIVLSRLFEKDNALYSVPALLDATRLNLQWFSRAALKGRKRSALPNWSDEEIEQYLLDPEIREPTIEDIAALQRAASNHRKKFVGVYRDIRNRIAHNIELDQAKIESLYCRTNRTEIDNMLRFVFNLVHWIRDLASNGTSLDALRERPDVPCERYGFSIRVARISAQAQDVLSSLKSAL